MEHEQISGRRDTGGETITALINEVFLLNGRLLRAGDALTREFGVTSARWQVLGALTDGPATAAEIARQRGLRRQSVREILLKLRADALVDTRPNPDDRRAPLVQLTPRGYEVLGAIQPQQARWANQLAFGFSTEQVQATVDVLRALRTRIDARSPAASPPSIAAGS